MDAVGDDAARRAAKAQSAREYRERNRDKIRESGRRYGESHKELKAATARRWKDANPERVREINRRWRAENLDRARQLNRESMRRASERNRRAAEVRRRANESSRRWKIAHADQARASKQRWVEANRDHVREYYRRYHAKNRDRVNARAMVRRDADPENMKRLRKEWADRNRERLAEYQRAYRSDPEKYQAVLDSNAAAKRLRVRLERAGLPPKQTHRSTAAERRSNERMATEYFVDPALPARLKQFTVFTNELTEHVLKNGKRMAEFAHAYVAMRSRMGLPAVAAEDVMYARAVQVVTDRMRRVDRLTSRDVAAAVRSVKAVVAQREREHQFKALVRRLEAHVRSNSRRLVDEAHIENVARVDRGKPRIAVDTLVGHIALQELAPSTETDWLTAADVKRALGVVRARTMVASVDAMQAATAREGTRQPHVLGMS